MTPPGASPGSSETCLYTGGGKTKLVSRSEYVSAEALKTVMGMGMLQGITETWDRLEERLNEVEQ